MTGIAMFDLEERALSLCETRGVMLARNLANASTPNYKAVDISFQDALKQTGSSASLNTTHSNHLLSSQTADDNKIYYRVPTQKSYDGNTVDEDIERNNFIENSLRYEASLEFIRNKASYLLKALKGN